MERYPNSLVWVLAQVKDGDEQFWKEKFHAANGKAQHSQTVQFFSCGHIGGWGQVGERGIFCFFPFFPMCSHHVPMKFPNTFLKVFLIAPFSKSLKSLDIVQLFLEFKNVLQSPLGITIITKIAQNEKKKERKEDMGVGNNVQFGVINVCFNRV